MTVTLRGIEQLPGPNAVMALMPYMTPRSVPNVCQWCRTWEMCSRQIDLSALGLGLLALGSGLLAVGCWRNVG